MIDTIDGFDDMFKSSRNNSLMVLVLFYSFHSMSLSCSGLPISEDSSIISFQNTLNDGQSCLFEDSLLMASGFKGHVEAEYSFFFSCIFGVMDDDFSSGGHNIDD